MTTVAGFAGLLVVDVHIPHSQSLKEKRSYLRSVKAHLQRGGYSVAEVAYQDLLQRAQLAISIVADGSGRTEQLLDEALRITERDPSVEVVVRQRALISMDDA
jgi:uncharacterized protein YlxP (DUF503 family)